MSSTQATSPRDTVSQPENISGIRSLSGVWLWVPRLATLALTLITIDYLFNLQIINIITRVESQFFYTVVALMLPLVFLLWPINRHGARDRVPWYDVLLFIAAVVVCAFFVYNAEHILNRGWEYAAPGHAVTLSFLFWAIVVEAVRRAGGWPIAVIVGGASLYPIFADVMPGPIQGFPSSPDATAIYLAMSREGIMGIPLQAFANLVIGFLLFGVALQQTGGGRFFINLAFSLLGHVRGGPAKVAVFSSGLMGSMSGSVITNVMTTGVMSIPAMRRMGFGKSYAAGVEACASTGGC